MIDEATLFAYLDGELGPEDARAVEAALAEDPALRSTYEEHRALRDRLRGGFATLLDEPVPPRLVAAVRPSARIIDLAEVRARKAVSVPRTSHTPWRAIAAALVAGLFGGYLLNAGPSSGPVVEKSGRMIASAPLARALDSQLASAGAVPGPIRVRLTFRNRDGAICRSFDGQAASGVACRAPEGWQVRGLFGNPSGGAPSDYRMASAGNPQLMALVDGMIAGDPFDAAQEQAAKAAGWKARP